MYASKCTCGNTPSPVVESIGPQKGKSFLYWYRCFFCGREGLKRRIKSDAMKAWNEKMKGIKQK